MKKMILCILILISLCTLVAAFPEGEGVALAPTFLDKLLSKVPYAIVGQGAEKPSDWSNCNNLEATKMLTTNYNSKSEYAIGQACPTNSMVVLYYCYGNDCDNLRYVATGYKVNGVRPTFTGLYENTFHFYKCYSCGDDQDEVCYIPDKSKNYCIPVQMSNYDCLIEDGYPIKSECENSFTPLTKLYCLIGRSCFSWSTGTIVGCLGQGGDVYYDDPRCGASPVYELPDNPNEPFIIPGSPDPDPSDCKDDEYWSPVAKACLKSTYYNVQCVGKSATCEVDSSGIYSLKSCQDEAKKWNAENKCDDTKPKEDNKLSSLVIGLIIFGVVIFVIFLATLFLALMNK